MVASDMAGGEREVRLWSGIVPQGGGRPTRRHIRAITPPLNSSRSPDP